MGEGRPIILASSSVMDDLSQPTMAGEYSDLSGEGITVADLIDPDTLAKLRRLR